MCEFKRGEHLISPRTGYSHHGLYLGRNQVIHYTGFSDGRHKGVIAITSLEAFCQGEGFTIQTYPFRVYDHEESADRACSRLGEDWYDILLNNCEHFVTWCILGIHHSHQVSRLITVAECSRRLLAEPVKPATTTALSGHMATAAGVAVGTGSAAGTTTTVVAGLTAVTAAPVLTTVGAGIAVGYGVKKLVDWLS
jgi:hypothetical protein